MPPKRSIRSVPSKSRRKPFSNKQKKLQLQQKRLRKRDRDDGLTPSAEDGGDEMEEGGGSSTETASEGAAVSVSKLNLQPHPGAAGPGGHYDPNRCLLHRMIYVYSGTSLSGRPEMRDR